MSFKGCSHIWTSCPVNHTTNQKDFCYCYNKRLKHCHASLSIFINLVENWLQMDWIARHQQPNTSDMLDMKGTRVEQEKRCNHEQQTLSIKIINMQLLNQRPARKGLNSSASAFFAQLVCYSFVCVGFLPRFTHILFIHFILVILGVNVSCFNVILW